MGLAEEKEKYIKACLDGRLKVADGARKIGYNVKYFYTVLARYRREGKPCLINGHRGMKYKIKKYPPAITWIVSSVYADLVSCKISFTYQNFFYILKYVKKLDVKKGWVYKWLKSQGYKSPKCPAIRKEKKRHVPRPERLREGELIQIDGSKHRWIKGLPPFCAHGAIDDATHSLKGLYFSVNESREGYFEMLYSMAKKGNLPQEFYSDWSSCFVAVPKNSSRMSVEEKRIFAIEHKTDFLKAVEALGIRPIFALSPQAKGRVERMWQTLQANLPSFFMMMNVKTIEEANSKVEWIQSWWNKEFSIAAKSPEKAYRKGMGTEDYDALFSVHADVVTHKGGVFSYMEHDFMVDGLAIPGVKLEMQISYRSGFTVMYHGKRVKARCIDDINMETYGDRMSITERDILNRIYQRDTHSGFVVM